MKDATNHIISGIAFAISFIIGTALLITFYPALFETLLFTGLGLMAIVVILASAKEMVEVVGSLLVMIGTLIFIVACIVVPVIVTIALWNASPLLLIVVLLILILCK
jgi:hypothetical protein